MSFLSETGSSRSYLNKFILIFYLLHKMNLGEARGGEKNFVVCRERNTCGNLGTVFSQNNSRSWL